MISNLGSLQVLRHNMVHHSCFTGSPFLKGDKWQGVGNLIKGVGLGSLLIAMEVLQFIILEWWGHNLTIWHTNKLHSPTRNELHCTKSCGMVDYPSERDLELKWEKIPTDWLGVTSLSRKNASLARDGLGIFFSNLKVNLSTGSLWTKTIQTFWCRTLLH